MKENIIIKKFPNGITLRLNPQLDFEELLKEIGAKFQGSRHFFQDAKLALALEGRAFSAEEEAMIVGVIQNNSDIQILCLVEKNEETNLSFVKAINKVMSAIKPHDSGQFYRGTMTDNQKIESDSSVVILGDVNAGCIVHASKDIVILGALRGEAHAGLDGEEGHYVAALEMSPEKLKIGDFRYRAKEKSRWGFKTKEKVLPKIAYVKDSRIVMDNITKELLEQLPF